MACSIFTMSHNASNELQDTPVLPLRSCRTCLRPSTGSDKPKTCSTCAGTSVCVTRTFLLWMQNEEWSHDEDFLELLVSQQTRTDWRVNVSVCVCAVHTHAHECHSGSLSCPVVHVARFSLLMGASHSPRWIAFLLTKLFNISLFAELTQKHEWTHTHKIMVC